MCLVGVPLISVYIFWLFFNPLIRETMTKVVNVKTIFICNFEVDMSIFWPTKAIAQHKAVIKVTVGEIVG